jgi:hypothetical protein
MKQLIVTTKVVNDFIEQPAEMISKTYCPKCTFSCYREVLRLNGVSHFKYFCHIFDGYPSLCENGTIGFYKYNKEESKRLSTVARDEFHY